MSINIVKKDLREAIDLRGIAQAFPLRYIIMGTSTITYDGEYLIINNVSGQYSAVGTGFGSPAYEATRSTYSLSVTAIVKAVDDDLNCYFFFLEPRKADYAEFQGFKTDAGAGSHKFEFRSGGTEEEDPIAGQDWTVDTKFRIIHYKDQSLCQGYIDGALVAECTDPADISAQPFSIYAGEPNGVARVMHLKYPPGIHEYS